MSRLKLYNKNTNIDPYYVKSIKYVGISYNKDEYLYTYTTDISDKESEYFVIEAPNAKNRDDEIIDDRVDKFLTTFGDVEWVTEIYVYIDTKKDIIDISISETIGLWKDEKDINVPYSAILKNLDNNKDFKEIMTSIFTLPGNILDNIVPDIDMYDRVVDKINKICHEMAQELILIQNRLKAPEPSKKDIDRTMAILKQMDIAYKKLKDKDDENDHTLKTYK